MHAALAYYYEHKDEIDADIEKGKRFVDELKAQSPPSKLQTLTERADLTKKPWGGRFVGKTDAPRRVVHPIDLLRQPALQTRYPGIDRACAECSSE